MKYIIYISFFTFLIGALGCTINPSDTIEDIAAEGTNSDGQKQYWRSRFGGKPNISAFRKGEQSIRKQLKKEASTSRDGGIMQWEELGPSNIGGRIRAIAVQPSDSDVLLIGAAAGGVWKSTDEGATWTLRTPYFSSYPVSSIAYDPFDDNIVYATTGEFSGGGPEFPGVGVLKSTDGGDSWIALPDPNGNDSLWLSKIAMNPLKANSFYVGGSNSGVSSINGGGQLFRTDDGGQNWDVVVSTFQGIASGSNYSDIAINPQDTAHIIIGTDINVWESFDSGQNWTDITTSSNIPALATGEIGGRCEVEINEIGGTTYITLSRYVRIGGADMHRSELWQSEVGSNFYSTLVSVQDSTKNKVLLPFGSQGQYDQVIWVDPDDQNRVIWGGYDMWRYDNGVNTRISDWNSDIDGSNHLGNDNSIHADQHVITPSSAYNGVTNNQVWIGNDGGIYGTDDIWNVTENSGWYAKNDGLNITQLYGSDVSLDGNVSVGGAQDNSYFFNNATNNSMVNIQPSTGDGGKCKVHKQDNDIIYASTQFGNFFRSTDGGSTFCHILKLDAGVDQVDTNSCGGNLTKYNQSKVEFIAPMEISYQDSDIIFAGGANVFKSEDMGENWDDIRLANNNVSITAIAVHLLDDDIISIGTNTGRVELTTDGGDNWSLIGNSLDLSALTYIVTDIAINPNNTDHILVSSGKPGAPQDEISNGNLWLTTNGGTTWTDISPTDFVHIETVAWHPTNQDWIYVGTNAGLLSSENLGGSWNVTPLISGMSDGPILTLITELFWQGNGTDATPYYLCAATHGRGLWRTKFPVRKKHYVDKNCAPCGTGSFNSPYKFFKNAVAAAGSGSTIVFKTGGTYDEVPASIFTNDRINIELMDNTVAPVIVK